MEDFKEKVWEWIKKYEIELFFCAGVLGVLYVLYCIIGAVSLSV